MRIKDPFFECGEKDEADRDAVEDLTAYFAGCAGLWLIGDSTGIKSS